MPRPRERVTHSLADHIADMLRADISAGTYKAGDRLPSISQLAAQHDAAKGTVQKAINALAADKLIQVWPGKRALVLDLATGEQPPQSTIDSLYSLVRRVHDRIDSYEQRLVAVEETGATSKTEAEAPAHAKPTTPSVSTADDDTLSQATIDDVYSLVLRLLDRMDGYDQRLTAVERLRESRTR
jgi:DNA-binding transcriptional MocR family regulator